LITAPSCAAFENHGSCTCCVTDESSKNCTPICPTGQDFAENIITGELCKKDRSTCSGNDNCGKPYTNTGAYCYTPEPNTLFTKANGSTSGPASISIIVDGQTFQLSTNPDTPTPIKLPANGSSNVQISVPTFTGPSTSRGWGYQFMADNYGNNNQWKGWVSCSGTAGEDFCTEVPNTNNTQPFVPTSKTVNQVLKEGAIGKISGIYTTTDKCSDTYKYSPPIEGYYVVDYIPDPPEPCTPGDVNCPWTEILTNPTARGCSTVTYSGNEANNELHIVADVTDTNSLDEIQAFTLWFSKDDSVPKLTTTSALCSAGYTKVADNACCPNGTTYSNGYCRAPSVKPFCKDANYFLATGSVSCCNNNATYINGKCVLKDPRVSGSSTCRAGYIKVGLNKCCPNDSELVNGGCVAKTFSSSCSTSYTKILYNNDRSAVCCPAGLSYSNGTCSVSTSRLDTGSNVNDLGIMIRKNGNTWKTPTISSTDAQGNLRTVSTGSDGNTYLKINNVNAIQIKDVTVNRTTAKVTFDYKIKFLSTPSNLSGMYHVYGGGLDTLMINGNLLDQSYFVKFFDWGVDLVNPTAEDIAQKLIDATNTNITWAVADGISGILRTVVSGYRVGGTISSPVTLFNKSGISLGSKVLPTTIPADDQIGLFDTPDTTWRFNLNTGETDRLNIGNNENGKIDLYVTTYDKACNTTGKNERIDLDPWVATRGATVFSSGSIISNAKDVSSIATLNGVFNSITEMTRERIDVGTELLSTRNEMISDLIYPAKGAVKASLLFDTNNTKEYWFTNLKRKTTRYIDELSSFTSSDDIKGVSDDSTSFSSYTTLPADFASISFAEGGRRVSDSCDGPYCYMYSETAITIPSDYVCDLPTLFISETDINISPNITSDHNTLSGCIFLAGNNITIEEGTRASTNTQIRYDYLEGYFIAENQIVFPIADTTESLRDGVEIYGGLVALGSSAIADEAVSIKRNLRLFSQINPTVVITYDNKYSSLSTIFFGTEAPLYKQEVGFKSF